ncbi:MAG: RNA-splicing ligase RtcB [Candidatus Omnitrophota bacterium]|nr:MAG: RNA-splicing ligase RtcB [Candidatus Omnitrophota bacterium]
MSESWTGPLEKVNDFCYEIPRTYKSGMRVPGRIYANQKMLEDIRRDRAPEQVANTAFLPGIVKYSLAMPDIHWGYGFCIGGVVATDPDKEGVIAPGGVGYDINCGVRLLRTRISYEEIKNRIEALINLLFQEIPAGLGSKGGIRLAGKEKERVLIEGAGWAVRQGYGVERDLQFTEEKGALKGADPGKVSSRAYERGKAQVGTLGSGNHFCEIQVIEEIYEPEISKVFGLFKGQITVMIHSGSRGFGYQICDDYLKKMLVHFDKSKLPDRQLVCAPLNSKEGRDYFSAMSCAANYAWANRQVLMHLVRKGFAKFFGQKWEDLGMELVYDVAHNIAKIEEHKVDGKRKRLCVHRKGATRAFPPFHPDIPHEYKQVGQPVIIPGDMGRHSFLLVGTEKAMEEAFGSTCHGAGRLMSRTAAIKSVNKSVLARELKSKGIVIRTAGKETLAEEAPQAYKDVEDVVDVVQGAGISKKVCRMKPLGVIKG